MLQLQQIQELSFSSSPDGYWSSTEYSVLMLRVGYNFNGRIIGLIAVKNHNGYYVRAVRAF